MSISTDATTWITLATCAAIFVMWRFAKYLKRQNKALQEKNQARKGL